MKQMIGRCIWLARGLLAFAALWLGGCARNAAERRAESLLHTAQVMEAQPGKDNMYGAYNLYTSIQRDYPTTQSAKLAGKRAAAMKSNVEWFRMLDQRQMDLDISAANQRAKDAFRE